MKKVLIGLAVLIVVAIIGYLAGPRVDPGPIEAVEPPPPLDALDGWLAEREARLGDVKPGAEKTIIWADPQAKARTPLALIYVHGFGATRKENAPTPDKVAADLGANLFYTRLAGHGRPGAAMGEVTASDWFADVREAVMIGERLGEKVVLIGSSTGGTLAVWLTHQPEFKDRVAALILISPNLGVPGLAPKLVTGPWGAQITAAVGGEPYSWTPHNAAQGEWWTTEHPSIALVHLMLVVEAVAGLPLAEPELPTLVVYHPQDDVISVPAIEAWLAANPRRQVERLEDDIERGNHIVASEIMSPARVEPTRALLVKFIREALGG